MKFKNEKAVREYLNNSKVRLVYKTIDIIKVLNKYGLCGNILNNDVAIQNVSQAKFLLIQDESISLSTYTYGFYHSDCKELSVNDILSIEIEEEVIHPHIFKSFDRVLMSKKDSCWNPEFFRCCGYGGYDDREINVVNYMSINGCTYTHCIPYEGNEELAFKPYNHEDGK